FNLPLPAKIKLTLGQLFIQQSVSIVGPTTGKLRINGSDSAGVLRITSGTISVSDLTIEHGKSDAAGGAIRNDAGTVTLTNCTLKGNKAQTGGGIYNDGTMTLINCTLRGNKRGGGIYNHNTLSLSNCTLKGNKGGGPGAIGNSGML